MDEALASFGVHFVTESDGWHWVWPSKPRWFHAVGVDLWYRMVPSDNPRDCFFFDDDGYRCVRIGATKLEMLLRAPRSYQVLTADLPPGTIARPYGWRPPR